MKKIVCCFFIMMGFLAFPQKENTVEEDKDLRFSVLPYYNFGKGVGMTSPDSIFQLNIRFRMQNRATYLSEEGAEEDEINAEIRRLRLRFDGYVRSEEHTSELQSRENLVCR